MQSSDSLNSFQSQESGVEKDARSQSPKYLLEKMSKAIARRENYDPKTGVDNLKVSSFDVAFKKANVFTANI